MSSTQTFEASSFDVALALVPVSSAPNHSCRPNSPSCSSSAVPNHNNENLYSAESLPHSQTFPIEPTPHVRIASCILAFFTAGLNDGSLGPLTPYFLSAYAIPTSSAAWLYLSSFIGWLIVALIGSHAVTYLRVPGTLMLGAIFQMFSQALRGWIPPFPLFAVSFGVASLGQGLQDSSANTFVAGVGERAHRWLGVIHASYGLGSMVGGLVSAAVAGGGENWWARFYWVPLGVGAVNAALVAGGFGSEWKGKPGVASVDDEGRYDEGLVTTKNKMALDNLKVVLRNKIVWAVSLFYFFHLAAGFTVGGWLVEFLVTVRNAPLAQYSYVSAGFYGGIALGRIILVEPTHRYGERNMLLLYSAIILVLQIVFWRVQVAAFDAVTATLMGFFLGPFFAAGISVTTKLLPKSLHASALGLIFVVAQAGGAVFPAITGIVANEAGVGVLQPVLIGLIVAMGVSWALVPKVEKRDENRLF